jgi:hypothetical protein
MRDGGLKALNDQIAAHCRDLDAALQENAAWGQTPHLEAPTWLWIVIAIIIAIALVVVFACLVWAGCAWLKDIFRAACWATAKWGGWGGFCAGL